MAAKDMSWWELMGANCITVHLFNNNRYQQTTVSHSRTLQARTYITSDVKRGQNLEAETEAEARATKAFMC